MNRTEGRQEHKGKGDSKDRLAFGSRRPGGTVPGLEQALPRRRSPIELSRDGDTLGGQKRQAELEAPKGLPHREPGGLAGRAPNSY
jgi:hypothetical protein